MQEAHTNIEQTVPWCQDGKRMLHFEAKNAEMNAFCGKFDVQCSTVENAVDGVLFKST